MEINTRNRFTELQACVIVPTYNNGGTIGALLQKLIQYTDHVIVVNDGSTDQTSETLERFPSISVVSYSKNKGKGWALRCGFDKARALGFRYAITIDSDGQHFPEDLSLFLDEVQKHPGCLIIGRRNMEQADVPGKSSFGNKFSNFWFWFETGNKLEDTQCGYRLYPLEALSSIHFFTRKFEFEIEVIVRAAWRGVKISAVPVRIHYGEKGERVSHFRPFRDFTRISILNTILVTIALVYIKPRDFFRRLLKKETREKLAEQLFQTDDSPWKKSASIGFGVFMGIVPIWGFQLITAITLSVLFRLNKALVILAANISIPPLIPFILYLSHLTGKIWMGKQATDISFDGSLTLSTLQGSFAQYLAGACILSVAAGSMATLISFVIIKATRRRPSAG